MRLFILFLALAFAGCATNRIDWDSRVGSYTYDQAVTELGVPDRSATLSDGTVVAEWLSSRGSSYGSFHSFPGSRLYTYDVNQFPDRFIRLIFGPDQRLTRFERFVR